jgi:hypothetical protein
MSTVTLWTWREGVDLEPDLSRITGFGVEARDGSIGKIDEATNEVNASYIVVDTGPWIFGKKVMIPASMVERVDYDNENVYVAALKEQIKDAPEFGESTYRSQSYRDELGGYYESR